MGRGLPGFRLKWPWKNKPGRAEPSSETRHSTPPSNISQTTMSLLDFPQELQQEIFSQLEDDKYALQTCAIVHRDFTHPCQQRLFSHIVIINESGGKNFFYYNGTIRRFNDLLDDSPHLGAYVESLRINDSVGFGQDLWSSSDIDRLDCITPLLENLQAFTLECHHSERSCWGTQEAFECISNILQLPCLIFAHIWGIPSISLIHAAGINLKHLWLTSTYDESKFQSRSLTERHQVALESLYIYNRVDMRALVKSFRAPNAAIRLGQLRKLCISRDIPYTSAQGHIWNIIELCAESLEDLIFVPGYCRFIDKQTVLQEYAEPIDLGRLSALRRARFDIDIGPQPWVYTQSMDPQGRDALEGWLDDLSNFTTLLGLPSTPCRSLEQVDINCCFHAASVHEDEEIWIKMADILLGDLYPRLSRLNIGIASRVSIHSGEGGEMTQEDFNNTLFVKKLRGNQKLTVRVFKHEAGGRKADLAEFPYPSWIG